MEVITSHACWYCKINKIILTFCVKLLCMSARINWISHKNPAMKTSFVQKVTVRARLGTFCFRHRPSCHAGSCKNRNNVLMKCNLFVPHTASSNKEGMRFQQVISRVASTSSLLNHESHGALEDLTLMLASAINRLMTGRYILHTYIS
jgi:hypothetical protein